MLKKLPQAVLFDHDGVLVASEPLHWEAWGKLLAELGLTYAEAEVRAQVGKTAPEILSSILDKHRPGWEPRDYDLTALSIRKNEFYLDYTKSRLKPYPGVLEGIAWLKKQGVKMAVVSNARKRELKAALDLLELSQYFDEIISRDDVKSFKPDPTPYLFAAASLGFEPAECLAVEDSPPGLEAALLAKVPTAAVMTNFPKDVLERPVPGRPDLRPIWVGKSIADLFADLAKL